LGCILSHPPAAMNEHELVWAMLPDGLAGYFTIESYEKTDEVFRIILVEKNTVPEELPEQYRGKKVINTVLKSFTMDFFPIKGRKGELILKRRLWQFEGLEMYKRPLELCFPGTKLENEFVLFLKEMDRD